MKMRLSSEEFNTREIEAMARARRSEIYALIEAALTALIDKGAKVEALEIKASPTDVTYKVLVRA